MANKNTRFSLGIVAFVLLMIFSSFGSLVNFIADYKWFTELGYTKTFLTKLITQIKIGVPAFLILFFVIMFYITSIKKKYYKRIHYIPDNRGEKKLNTALGILTAGISLFVSLIITSDLWFTILQYMNSTEFNVKDPIYGKDISFYVFQLPLIKEILSIIIILAVLLIVLTVVFYMLMMSIRRPSNNPDEPIDFDIRQRMQGGLDGLLTSSIFKDAFTQIGTIGLIVFISIGVNYLLKSYDLLYSTRGIAYGASYTDIHVTLWLYRIMAVIGMGSAIGFFIGVKKKNIKIAVTGPVVLIIVSMLGGISSGVIQKLIVEPDEISKEEQYLQYNIEYTQKAYGLEEITEKDFIVDQKLTKEDLLKNEDTIKNIRINDYRPVQQVYNQIQGIRPYYNFLNVDSDRYYIDGEYTQVFLSARELNQEKISEQAKSWINKYLKYTHGYGFTLSPVNSITKEGQTQLLVRDIPPVTNTDLKIERPEIYFGELTDDYIIVNTDEKEFDYAEGETNKETIYQGTAGIELNTLNKLLFAIKQGDLKLILSGNINSDSKIIINRNIKDRVEKIAPFIYYDEDPYLVISQEDGKLYWIMDGYTMSNKYPYSEPFKNTDVNYIRNSVKVTIDVYNGDTKYYVFDEEDPIIMTYKKIFPDLFSVKEEMPEGLKSHVRYPRLLFDIQTDIYKVYHMNNPRVFYNRDDVWDIAKEKYMHDVQPMESNYAMFKLPDEEKEEFLLTIPYTPHDKANMTALFVARNDGDNYGKIFIYKFPKTKTISGPMMIESRIDQDSKISPQLTLWGQKGSSVLRGNVLVVPIENSLLYVEPIYLQADNENSLPEVKMVIVAYEDNIVMEETLDKALSKIFGEIDEDVDNNGVVEGIDANILDGNTQELINKANSTFEKAKEASQNGDWSRYGRYIDELESILKQLNITLVPQENQ